MQNSIELNKSSWPFPKSKFQPSGQRFQHQSGVLSLLGLAIDILRRRITHRYLNPVGVLVNAETKIAAAERRFGLTILAIDCLLLETLQAFRMGLPNTKGKSKIIFQRFLTTHDRFSRYFDIELANQFYEEFRCGIFHQAEIGGMSRVWSVGRLVQLENNRLTINRSKFHRYICFKVQNYLNELKDKSQVELRVNFRKKMAHIAAIS